MLTTLCAALVTVVAPQDPAPGSAAAPAFAAPIRLTADGGPLATKITYPSPRLLDIDADGALELVVGDLPGRVHVAEKVGEDHAAWTPLAVFESHGRALKFHNW